MPKLDCFFSFDYSNMELRLLGYYLAVALGDYSVVDEFLAGSDLHRTTASRIFEKAPHEVTDQERQVGKVLQFSLLYGGGAPTVMRQGLAKDYLEAKALIEAYHEARPGVKRLSTKLIDSYESKGHISLVDGSRLHPESNHKALNTLIQGSGAAIMRNSFRNIYRHLSRGQYKSHIVNSTHDDFLLDVARSEIFNVVESVPKLMGYEKVDKVIPLEVDIEWSTETWADKKAWKGVIE